MKVNVLGNFRLHQKVKVIKRIDKCEDWDLNWLSEMDGLINKECKIIGTDQYYGYLIEKLNNENPDKTYYVPADSLVDLRKEKLKLLI